jgi:ABC-type multidrug transport system fused ATPase/permease subunit
MSDMQAGRLMWWPALQCSQLRHVLDALMLAVICSCHRPELPPVLKGISFSIGTCEKVGICGRTGGSASDTVGAVLHL